MTKIKKIIATIILSVFLFATVSPIVVHGSYWGTNMGASILKQALEAAYLVLRKTILMNLKKEANNMIRKSIEKAVSGSSGESMVVADYEDFIFGSAQVAAEDTLDDFFTVLQEGVSTTERDMLRGVEQTISKQLSPEMPEVTLREIVDSADPVGDVFDQTKGGGIGALLSYQLGDYNNSTNAYINAKNVVESAAEQVTRAQEAEVIAGGGFNTIVEGSKVIPGKISQEIVAAAETMPIEMINNAGSLEEIIASFVTSSLSGFIKNGINVVSEPIDNEMRKIENSVTNGVSELQDKIKKGLTT